MNSIKIKILDYVIIPMVIIGILIGVIFLIGAGMDSSNNNIWVGKWYITIPVTLGVVVILYK